MTTSSPSPFKLVIARCLVGHRAEGHSLKDVAAAGGWKDTDTLLRCYQQPDKETLLAVMSEERKLREAVSGA